MRNALGCDVDKHLIRKQLERRISLLHTMVRSSSEKAATATTTTTGTKTKRSTYIKKDLLCKLDSALDSSWNEPDFLSPSQGSAFSFEQEPNLGI